MAIAIVALWHYSLYTTYYLVHVAVTTVAGETEQRTLIWRHLKCNVTLRSDESQTEGGKEGGRKVEWKVEWNGEWKVGQTLGPGLCELNPVGLWAESCWLVG